jgi:hypothetical protein
VMLGVVGMLAVAGLLEGIGRQTINNDIARACVGSVALIGWLLYFYVWPMQQRNRGVLDRG